MALTRSFRDTVKEELASEDFRRAFLCEAIRAMVAGDLETAKVVLREYVNGTIGFPKLGAALGRSPKSLMRMLSPTGNPQARNLSRWSRISRRLKERYWKCAPRMRPPPDGALPGRPECVAQVLRS